jgi:hypothetical protein
MKEVSYTEDSLTVTNSCPDCIAQETLCVDCVDEADARLTDKAYQLVDEGNLQYRRPWLITTEPSGHDWVSPETRVEPYFVWATQSWEDTRSEFLEPTSLITDRILGSEVYDPRLELHDEEVVCKWCHLVTLMYNPCPNCEEVNS